MICKRVNLICQNCRGGERAGLACGHLTNVSALKEALWAVNTVDVSNCSQLETLTKVALPSGNDLAHVGWGGTPNLCSWTGSSIKGNWPAQGPPSTMCILATLLVWVHVTLTQPHTIRVYFGSGAMLVSGRTLLSDLSLAQSPEQPETTEKLTGDTTGPIPLCKAVVHGSQGSPCNWDPRTTGTTVPQDSSMRVQEQSRTMERAKARPWLCWKVSSLESPWRSAGHP